MAKAHTNDRSWLLNPNAIRAAKHCIFLVKSELGIKLLLSHPDFMPMLHSYVNLTESKELGLAYSRLISHAGAGTVIQGLSKEAAKALKLK